MNAGPVKDKKNRALPFKATLLDSENNPVSDSDINALPVIQVIYNAGTEPAVDVTDEAIPVGLGTTGNQFEYTYDGKWQYNLKTKNYTASGRYTVTMISGDNYTIDPACAATFIIN